MRRLASPTLAAAVLVLAACASCPPPMARPPGPAERAAVLAVLEHQREAWNRGDLDGYLTGYLRSPALVFTSGGAIRRGFDETAAKYRARYGGDRAGMGKLAFEILEVQWLGHDGAIVLGRWRLTETPNAGAGVFSVALERRPEGWRIVHDHTSSAPPPTAAP